MRNSNFLAWKQDMAAHGMLESISHITAAPLEDYWRFTTACNLYKQLLNNAMDLRLGNYMFKGVEGAWLPGADSILPLPPPDYFPSPIPDPTDPSPYLPTETFLYRRVATAEGGPGGGVGGVPRGEAAFADFVADLWNLPALEDFQAVAKRTALQVDGKTMNAFDFFQTVSGGDWPELYKNVKLAIGGQREPAVAYFRAQFQTLPEGTSYESYGTLIGGAIGTVAGAIIGGAPTAGLGAVYGSAGGGAVGGCLGGKLGEMFNELDEMQASLVLG